MTLARGQQYAEKWFSCFNPSTESILSDRLYGK
jgi:hypothetical protein